MEEVIEAEPEDERQNMHCLEEDLSETSKKVAEVRGLDSIKTAEIMAETEENNAEVRQVTRCNMADMEENAAEMAREMRRATRCMKAETRKMKVEVYECLAREKEKVKHEYHLKKGQTSIYERSRGASRYLSMCPFLD